MTAFRPLALAAALALPLGAEAATVAGHTGLVIFGDSLSDTGNLFAATGGAVPAAPYVNGRFSNGPIWADDVAAGFAAAGLFAKSFAFGSADAVTNGDAIPDLAAQLGLFDAAVPKALLGDKPLAALWFGANDLFDALDAFDTIGHDGVVAAGVAAAAAVAGGIASLVSGGISDVVVFNLPDLGAIPAYALFDPARAGEATAGSAAFNAALDGQIATLRAGGANVTEVDIFSLFNDLLADPAKFGVVNATVPCLIPGVSVCDLATAGSLAFFDPVHPSDTIHAVVADRFGAALAPAAVPLPAAAPLLLAALAAAAALGLRRKHPPAAC